MQIAVFCGSAKGSNPIYEDIAVKLSNKFIQHDIGLVYGGGSIGLMGVIADQILRRNGHVHGIIPKKIYDWEVGHEGISKLEIVDTMHERKARMADLADAFIAIPGGIGTLDELIEILTWKQLGYHDKPIAILNVNGLFDHFISLLNQMKTEGFLSDDTITQLSYYEDEVEMVDRLVEEIQAGSETS